jgi:hypothetical protein
MVRLLQLTTILGLALWFSGCPKKPDRPLYIETDANAVTRDIDPDEEESVQRMEPEEPTVPNTGMTIDSAEREEEPVSKLEAAPEEESVLSQEGDETPEVFY